MTSVASIAPIFGVFAAVIGAVVGAWVNQRFREPKPTILVDHLEITSTSTRAPNAVTVTNRELIITLEDDPFVGKPSEIQSATVHEGEYVTYLRGILENIDEVINYKLPTARALAEQLRDCLTTDDYESFERIWAQDQANIWQLLVIGLLRGDFSYSDKVPNESNFPAFRDVNLTDSRILVVSLPGAGRDITFDWSLLPETQQERVEVFAQRTANAIARHIRDDLVQAIRFLLNGSRYEPALLELREKVKKELKAHDRLLLRGQISNTGGSPFAVLNNGRVFVATDKYPYTKVDSNGDKTQLRYQGDMQIKVLLGEENRPYESSGLTYTFPLSVAPGTTSRFIAVSEKLIKDLDEEGVLSASYNMAERTFYLGTWVILPGRRPQRSQYTTPQLFRNWETENEVPPRSGSISRNRNTA